MLRPRPHQAAAINAVVEAFKTHNAVQIHMACGSGKTFIAHQVSREVPSKKLVMFVPTIFLAHQACEDFRKYSADDTPYLVVCSRTMTPAEHEEVDELRKHMANVTVCTSPTKIRDFINAHDTFASFCTYKSSDKFVRMLNQLKVNIDLAICDESHHLVGNVDKVAHCILNSFRFRKMLSQTATPMHVSAATMISQDRLGPIVHILPLRSAVDQGILCPFDLQISTFTSDELTAGDPQFAVALAAITRAIKEHRVSRGLTFHHSVSNARRFRNFLKRHLPDLPVFTLSYTSSATERDAAIGTVRKSGGIITNVRVLSEGFNFPELDFAVMVDSKTSVRDIVQSIGRVIRKSTGKDKALIIAPCIYDKTKAIQPTDQRKFINIVEALAQHDEVLYATLTNVAKDSAPALETFANIFTITSTLPSGVVDQIRHNLVNLFVPGHLSADTRFEELKAFVEKNKRLPRSVDEHNLYAWMHNQLKLKTSFEGDVRATMERFKFLTLQDFVVQTGVCQRFKNQGRATRDEFIRRMKEIGICVDVERAPSSKKLIYRFPPEAVEQLKTHVEAELAKVCSAASLMGEKAKSSLLDWRLKRLGIKTTRSFWLGNKVAVVTKEQADQYRATYG